MYKHGCMPLDDYRRALDAAVAEYERSIADRAALDARLAQLQETIRTLTKLCGFTPTVPFGLTDACRLVLRNAAAPLTAVEVRERLTAIGFDHEKYANGLAAIHTVLKRLEESGEVALAERDDVTRQAYAFLASGLIASRVAPPPAIAARGRSQGHRRGRAK
jgi:hypothetical protein